MRSRRLLVLSACTSLLAGCVSNLDSRIATPTAEGQRYSLPQPILKVEPQADGTMTLEVIYLPDPNNTYTVRASSFVGAYTLDVKTKEGLLDTVTFSPNSSAVVEALATSAGNIEKAKIDARSKADEAAAKAAEAEAKAISDANAAVALAQAKLDKLKELKAAGGKVTDEQIVAAEVELSVAKAKLDTLGSTSSTLNLAANAAGAGGGFPEAPGPVFFAMVPRENGIIDLVASSPQIKGETAVAVPVTPKVTTVSYTIIDSSVLRLGSSSFELRLQASPTPKSIVFDDIELSDASDNLLPALKPTVDLTNEDGKSILVVTPADATPVGNYKLIIPVIGPDGSKQQPATIRFEVRPKLPK